MRREAEAFVLNPTSLDWWDTWHYHADWPGWGNLGWRYRLPHLSALAAVFQKVCDASGRFTAPFQTWILIDGEDAGQDATYVHTPNPNGTEFPLVVANAEWGVSSLQSTMQSLLPGLDLDIGWTRAESPQGDGSPEWRTAHWVYARGIGMPLRAG
ncbi:MAG: hypothetical protein R3B13_21375 [Polyangiaceae bacterium]